MADNASRVRRTPEQLIADLQKRIDSIKARAEQRKAKKSPALRHMLGAVKAIDKALAESDDSATRKALDEARGALSACLALSGVVVTGKRTAVSAPTGGRRSAGDLESVAESLLEHISNNPGQRGEQIAAALGTDVKTMRLPMKKLIEERRVKTRGQRRGMTYFAT